MTRARQLAACVGATDPLRPIPTVPLCNGPDPRMLELAGKDQWTDDDWAYALAREAEGDAPADAAGRLAA